MKKKAFVLSLMMLLGVTSYAQLMGGVPKIRINRSWIRSNQRRVKTLDDKLSQATLRTIQKAEPPVSSTKVPTAPSRVPSTVNSPREIPGLPVSRSLAVSRPNSPDIVNKASAKLEKAKEAALAAAVADIPVFDSQAHLARYVHEYYVAKGEPGQRLEMDNGKVFIRYDVPYQVGYFPPEFKHMESIENKDYFIIYEVGSQTGQLVKRIPCLEDFFTAPNFH